MQELVTYCRLAASLIYKRPPEKQSRKCLNTYIANGPLMIFGCVPEVVLICKELLPGITAHTNDSTSVLYLDKSFFPP